MPEDSPELDIVPGDVESATAPREAAAPPARGNPRVRRMAFVALAIATLMIAALGLAWIFDVDFEDGTEEAIRDFASSHRRTDLRFPGARYTPMRSSPMMTDQFDLSASTLSIVEADLNDTLSKNPGDSDALLAIAQIHLLNLRVYPAIDILERLHPFHRDDPKLLGLLAYGYYLRGRAENRTRDILRSIDLLEKALQFAPDDPVLLFNAGTACSRANIRNQAKLRYSRYLEIDRDSGWAAELRARLIQLNQSAR